MSTEVRVGIIAGSAQVAVALIALFGVLSTAGQTGGAQTAAAVTPPAAAPATPTMSVSCTDIIEGYRRMVLLDSTLLAALVTAGPDGISPVEADPDARRCGVSEAVLRAMR
jgi:hypothetical protein